jgi:hypothetical protein
LLWYDAGPLGISGDDDNGEESSWYVLSAMGFFTVCPGRPVYDIGSPIFEETRITLGNGKVFTIAAKGVSSRNKYVQSATLNGKPLNKPWVHARRHRRRRSARSRNGPAPERRLGQRAGCRTSLDAAVSDCPIVFRKDYSIMRTSNALLHIPTFFLAIGLTTPVSAPRERSPPSTSTRTSEG